MCSSDAGLKGGTASRSDRPRRSRLRLSAPEHFRLAYREGTRISNELLVLYARPNGLEVGRFGISVPSRAGGAVQRNRIRRRLREAGHACADAMPAGVDLVIVPRPGADRAPFAALQDSMRGLFNRAAGVQR